MAAELLRDLSRATDANSDPLPGATWEFYDSGTLTPRTVYADAGKVTSLGSIVTADAAGRFVPIYLDAGFGYRGIQKSAAGAVIQDIDPINDSALADVVAALDVLKVDVAAGNAGIGTGTLSARFTIKTSTSSTGNAQHIYHYAQQTDPANQTSALATHNYTDGVGVIFDNVGAGYAFRIKQANNAAARADKASDYIGLGPFMELQRSRIDGAGAWPTGNIGGNRDRLTSFNAYGNLCTLGTDATDWEGGDGNAPIQLGTYANLLSRKLYMGYQNSLNRAIIGAVDTVASAFTPIDLACLALRPLGDNTVVLGANSLRFTYVHAFNVKTAGVTVANLPNAVTAGAGTRAFVTDATVVASGNFGATVTGGGANNVPVFSDGSNWLIG